MRAQAVRQGSRAQRPVACADLQRLIFQRGGRASGCICRGREGHASSLAWEVDWLGASSLCGGNGSAAAWNLRAEVLAAGRGIADRTEVLVRERRGTEPFIGLNLIG